jgi:hypothetical protein
MSLLKKFGAEALPAWRQPEEKVPAEPSSPPVDHSGPGMRSMRMSLSNKSMQRRRSSLVRFEDIPEAGGGGGGGPGGGPASLSPSSPFATRDVLPPINEDGRSSATGSPRSPLVGPGKGRGPLGSVSPVNSVLMRRASGEGAVPDADREESFGDLMMRRKSLVHRRLSIAHGPSPLAKSSLSASQLASPDDAPDVRSPQGHGPQNGQQTLLPPITGHHGHGPTPRKPRKSFAGKRD